MTSADIEYAVSRITDTKRDRIEALYADPQLTAADRVRALKELCGTSSWSLTFPDGTAGWLNCSRSKGVEVRKGAYGSGDVTKLTWAKAEKIVHGLVEDGRC